MPVPVKLDEPLSSMLVAVLVERGYSTLTVRQQGWGGFKDAQLWPLVLAEQVYFVTADKGFGDVRRYPPGTHRGILVLRPAKESLPEFKRLLQSVLNRYNLDELVGCITVATARSIRIRRK